MVIAGSEVAAGGAEGAQHPQPSEASGSKRGVGVVIESAPIGWWDREGPHPSPYTPRGYRQEGGGDRCPGCEGCGGPREGKVGCGACYASGGLRGGEGKAEGEGGPGSGPGGVKVPSRVGSVSMENISPASST